MNWKLFCFTCISFGLVLAGNCFARSNGQLQGYECETPPEKPPIEDDMEGKTLWELLDIGEKKLILSPINKEAILLLGITGTGKSVVTQLTVGNDTDLYVYRTLQRTYVVQDSGNKIGTSTKSQTYVPELVVNAEQGLALYDMPGFSDNRGPDVDIMFNYLLKKVTDHLNGAKIVFMTTWSALDGEDKRGFEDLANYAVQLIPDFDKLGSSIGLIVNKSPNRIEEDEMTDHDLIKAISHMLQRYRNDWEQGVNTVRASWTERNTAARKVEFIDILLKPGNTWFLRKASSCGPFLENKGIQDSQKALQTLMKDTLSISPTNGSEFHYSLSFEALRKVDGYVEDINKNVSAVLGSELVAELRKAQDSKSTEKETFELISAFWKEESLRFKETLQLLKANISLAQNLETFGRVWKNTLKEGSYETKLGQDFHVALSQLESYLSFFQEMSDKQDIRNVEEWLSPWERLETWLSKKVAWYEFLAKLKTETLSNYNNLKVWLKEGLQVPNNAGLDFLINRLGVTVDSLILEINQEVGLLSQQDREMLTSLMKIALRPTESSCSGDKQTIKGGYVLTSSIPSCPAATSLLLLATEGYFADANLRPGTELHIISPKWEVVGGSRIKIDMKGAQGTDPGSKADNGRNGADSGPTGWNKDHTPHGEIGQPGTSGSPGEPGVQGGHFFGLTSFISNPSSLEVDVSGGSGGGGQEGGNGGKGGKGANHPYASWPGAGGPCPDGELRKKFDYVKAKGCVGHMCDHWDLERYGNPGGRGGRGGDGGAGGKGAPPGELDFTNFASPQITPTLTNNTGSDGELGVAGIGGEGGQRGGGSSGGIVQTILIFCHYEKGRDKASDERAGSDGDGVEGKNTVNQKPPSTTTFRLERSKTVADFKLLAIENQLPKFPNPFLPILEKDSKILQLYTPKTFAYELYNLESSALSLAYQKEGAEAELILLPRYEAFLSLLSDYSETVTDLKKEDAKVLAIVYTAGLARIQALATARLLSSSVVINVEGFMGDVLRKFQTFRSKLTEVIVDEEREVYLATFEEKILQAMNFIGDTVQPSIAAAQGEMKANEDLLLDEVQKLLTAAENEAEARRRLKESMKSTLGLRIFLSTVQIGGAALSFLGPMGAAVGGLASTGANLGKLGLGEYDKNRPSINVPPGVSNQAKEMENAILLALNGADLVESAKEIVSFARLQAADNPGALSPQLLSQIGAVEESVRKYEDGLEDEDVSQSLQNAVSLTQSIAQLEEALETQNKELKDIIDSPNSSTEDKDKAAAKKKVVERVKNANSFAKAGMDAFKEITGYINDLDKMSDLVEEAEAAVMEIRKYRDSVFTTLIPMITNVMQDINNMTESLEGGNQVTLQVQKWQITQTLNDFKFFLELFTEGFSATKHFVHTVEKLTEAIKMMIDLYELIDKFSEQMRFADYLANIVSPSANNIVIPDQETRAYVNKVQLSTQASVLLQEYGKAVQAFEQWVFPFASVYEREQDFYLPDKLSQIMDPGNNITTTEDVNLFIIPSLEEKVRLLDDRLKSYKNLVIPGIDDILVSGTFHSGLVSSHPFYIWKRERNEEAIGSFLRGDSISLVSPPQYAYRRRKSAVKFRVVDLRPMCRDKELQRELENLLKEYTVSLTHSGVSNYLVKNSKDQEVSMVGSNVTLFYSYEKGSNGQPVFSNQVYNKIKDGDYILSPFTTWKAKLELSPKYIASGFESLDRFLSCVDLVLEGEGSFVKEDLGLVF